MKELSLHILDIAQNSVKAKSSLVEISLLEAEGFLTLTVSDNGCGMDADFLARVSDPFCTTRTTRSVGLGIPLLKLAAEQCGGSFSIESTPGEGTSLQARFAMDHIDRPPVGDMVSTLVTLIQGAPDIDFLYLRRGTDGCESSLSTKELREALGAEISLSEPEVLAFIRDSLHEEERQFL